MFFIYSNIYHILKWILLPLGRPRRTLEYNTKMDLRAVDVEAWTVSFWLRTGKDGGQL
jgi:hypothetical protein